MGMRGYARVRGPVNPPIPLIPLFPLRNGELSSSLAASRKTLLAVKRTRRRFRKRIMLGYTAG